MEKINEIKIPKGVESISVTQHDDKIVIDFMPKKPKFKYVLQPKFKVGDSVMIKDGISSKTHRHADPHFTKLMDEYIGKELIVIDYPESGSVRCNNGFYFAEDWLEFIPEELKKDDLAIFWDNGCLNPIIRLYHTKSRSGRRHFDSFGTIWDNAIKFESKEQFEKVLRGEI